MKNVDALTTGPGNPISPGMPDGPVGPTGPGRPWKELIFIICDESTKNSQF